MLAAQGKDAFPSMTLGSDTRSSLLCVGAALEGAAGSGVEGKVEAPGRRLPGPRLGAVIDV